MQPDETGACYLYEFLAAHRRWKLHVTLNDEKTFFILRLFPGRNALVFDPRYLHAAAQICNAENDSVKSGALFVGRRPEGLVRKNGSFRTGSSYITRRNAVFRRFHPRFAFV